jgi:thiopurine S-methyltransferase
MTDKTFWLNKWQNNEIGFHLETVHPLLERFWPSLNAPKNARVFVPLCGKTLDMDWLLQQGHQVFGVELSSQAIEAFFKNNQLVAETKKCHAFTLYQAADLSIYNGGFFQLSTLHLGRIDYIYDRAALIAMPNEKRQAYVKQLKHLSHANTQILLISLEHESTQFVGPPFSLSKTDIKALFSPWHVKQIYTNKALLEERSSLKKQGLTTVTHTVYLIQR